MYRQKVDFSCCADKTGFPRSGHIYAFLNIPFVLYQDLALFCKFISEMPMNNEFFLNFDYMEVPKCTK